MKRCARIGVRAPVGHRRADDHQVAVDQRRHRPAALRRERGELLAERPVPQQFAVAAQRDHLRHAAQGVDVAGLGIGRRRRPPDAVRRHVALEDVELVFPDHLAGVGVERHHALLQIRATPGRILQIEAVADHDRRRPAAVRRAPEEVLPVERPLVDQPGFLRDAVAVGTAHVRPVADRHAARPLRGHTEGKEEQQGGYGNSACPRHRCHRGRLR